MKLLGLVLLVSLSLQALCQNCESISGEGEHCITTEQCQIAGNCKEGYHCKHFDGTACPLVPFSNCHCQRV
ncbi:hypothetical protein BCV72DRAFT_101786 [Rhizopus microsporus var. microsporus]|uniref:EGF-like domain-containing protein n=1 Tax=Rhizopus microsporus var. microsporus TaxID=86635 RepID=A0A1X0R711_RHIZD|nr:hypothetical protein BCV72DRAFT_101786 [Rhizopus microsporus var. microsporus]